MVCRANRSLYRQSVLPLPRNAPMFTAFDAKRLQRSADFLSEFAEVRSIRTPDGATLEWALYTPQKFEKWIQDHGGVHDGEWITPRTDADWPRLEKLGEFKWFEKVGHAFRAPVSSPQGKCILRCQGFGRQMPMDKAYIGLHLAAGLNYTLFNWRNELSGNGLFQDAETIYQALRQEGFSPRQIVAMGSCRATFVVARLLEMHHAVGLNAVMIYAPPSLRAAIDHTPWPACAIGRLGLKSLENEGFDFDTLKRLKKLPFSQASTCLIMNQQDKTLPENSLPLLKDALEKCGPCEMILEPPTENTGDPHFDEPLRNPDVLKRYLAFLNQV